MGRNLGKRKGMKESGFAAHGKTYRLGPSFLVAAVRRS
jgi:hypothetical protein